MRANNIVITVMSGAEDGKVFETDKNPIILGRHKEDDICLPYDTRVSRHHARITREGESYFIEDTGPEGKGSTNGTYISEKRIAARVPIFSGDMFILGAIWLKIEKAENSEDKGIS